VSTSMPGALLQAQNTSARERRPFLPLVNVHPKAQTENLVYFKTKQDLCQSLNLAVSRGVRRCAQPPKRRESPVRARSQAANASQ